jgi:glutathione S-transferase
VLRLVTIPISHYCEKARWALDRAGLPYREEPHVQGIHRVYARRAGGGLTVPVLVTESGAIGESAQIIEWVDAKLEPGDRLLPEDPAERERVRALSARLDDRLGPSGRRLLYVHIMRRHETMIEYNNHGVPAWEGHVLRMGWPVAARFLAYALGIRPGVEVQDEADVWAEFDHVASLLQDGRPYLIGDRFSAADVTFAALAAPLVVPPTYGVPLPPVSVFEPALQELVARARAHPAGAFALRVVEEQRRARVGSAARIA